MSIAYNVTEKNVSMVLDGKPQIIPKSSAVFQQVIDAIRSGDLDTLRYLVSPKKHIATFTEGRIEFDGSELRFNGDAIHNSVKDRLHYLWSEGLDLSPLMRFLDNLMDNPSYRAVNETYGFLEACDLPITNDGHFLAYKMVRNNYTDIFSGKMANALNTFVSVPRNQVDENSERTCSYGLHVCSQGYLGCYGSGRGSADRVLIVKVNPRDVVAVPSDYNNAKMRVCAYEVVGELSWDDVGLDRYHTSDYSSNFDEEYDEDFDEDFDEGYDDYADGYDDYFNQLEELEEETVTEEEVPVTVHSTSRSGKLDVHQVKDIKRLLDEPESVRMSIVNIARLHQVDESTVRKIRDGLIHRDITI